MSSYLNNLNDAQKEAVLSESRYQLIIAGAGSGKTTVLTTKIIHMIKTGQYSPNEILAVTFTNKAAMEMRERIDSIIGSESNIMVKTFHSFGTYLLRKYPENTGRTSSFQIYDADDSYKVVAKSLEILENNKNLAKQYCNLIQQFKMSLDNPDSIMADDVDFFIKLNKSYNDQLRRYNAFDFEDLIVKPISIMKNNPDITDQINRRFKFILVDEYQDSNYSQFMLIKILASGGASLTVVGDEDQSIYSFRGAEVTNILNFEKHFPGTQRITLELNYRSTPEIIDLANRVINCNKMRLGKTLYTVNNCGELPVCFVAEDEEDEVKKVISYINEKSHELGETAVLYRTNNQSRIFEQVFNRYNIPYQLIGSIRFFEREEIKDALALLRWFVNPFDLISFERIISKPSKGIGTKTLDKIYKIADKENFNILSALKFYNNSKYNDQLNDFIMAYEILNNYEFNSLDQILTHLVKNTGLLNYFINKDNKDGTDKAGNILELVSSAKDRGCDHESIINYLEEVSLTGSGDVETDTSRIKILTIHNAKGLEFDTVFVTGMEDGVFPNTTLVETTEEIEEERRLFYVSLTRARKNLYISYAKSRNIYGRKSFQTPSQLLYPIFDYEKILPNNRINDKSDFNLGNIVIHNDYGRGKVIDQFINGDKRLIKVDFYDYGEFTFIEKYSKLRIIGDNND